MPTRMPAVRPLIRLARLKLAAAWKFSLDNNIGLVVAFPGAIGFGAAATGGRGGSVYVVTNLNNSGAGSFRDAVSHSNRIVVFDVGGYINLSTPVSVSSNITILGQTAPGQGIGIMSSEVSFSGKTNDNVQYMRFRQGSNDSDSTDDSINLGTSSNMIFSHCSIEFGQYDNIDAVGATNVTFQNSLVGMPSKPQQFNAHAEGDNFTWAYNVFTDAHGRSVLTKGNTQYIGNVVYDYGYAFTAGNTAAAHHLDVVNNYFITGPSTNSANDDIYQVEGQDLYNSGNYLDSNKNGALDGSLIGTVGGTVVETSAFYANTAALASMTAAQAYAFDLATAGDSLSRDDVDNYILNNLASLGKLGAIQNNQVHDNLSNNGYGTITGGTIVDSDGDGIPDSWELANGLNPNLADSSKIDPATGYAYIEDYAFSLVSGIGTGNAVPEPASIGLIALGVPILLRRRRKA